MRNANLLIIDDIQDSAPNPEIVRLHAEILRLKQCITKLEERMNRPWIPKGHDLDTTNPPREFSTVTPRYVLAQQPRDSIILKSETELLQELVARLEKRIQELEELLSDTQVITIRAKYLEG